MERDAGDLVAHAGEHEDDRYDERKLGGGLPAERMREEDTARDVRKLGRDPCLAEDAGRREEPVEQAHPVEHHARGDAAVDDVLQRRLVRLAISAAEAGEDVADERDGLDGQVDGEQVARARHQVHAEDQREEQGEELAEAVRRDLTAVRRDDDGEERRAEEDPGEEHPQRIVLEEPSEERRRPRRHLQRGEGDDGEPDESAGGEIDDPPRAPPREQVLHEHRQHGDGEDALRQEETEGREVVHQASPARRLRSDPSMRLMIAAG